MERTLPWAWYTEHEQLRRERELVFSCSWQYAGHTGLVPEPGFYAATLAGHVPVVLVRDGGGTLRAFLNVCRHRGHPVAAGAGSRETLQCRYHGWTYGLDGSLRAAPRSGREPGFELDGIALRPVSVDTWGPLVFVNPSLEPPPLREALGRLPETVPLDGLEFRFRDEFEVAANWKVVCENYLECYHCQIAHPGFSRLVDVSPDVYRLEAEGLVLSQFGPERDTGALGGFHFLWPNLTINVWPGGPNLSIGPVVPLDAGRTWRFLDYFFAPGADEEWMEELLELDGQVGREDRALVEAVQRGVSSGLVEDGRLLPESEQLVARFQQLVRQAVG
ncbi:MAG TPA: aromatic ring-hydroxylating dioxygenase subunit alpha [Gaiellaceae bacterium]|nr:aromatic ring-hydroxylating dioxygenase subunit alpha [Gaiellaceae bacterium]